MSPDSLSRTTVGGEGVCTRFQNNECFVVCYSESGTFLGLGTVTGSVAIYIAFSLQVMGRGWHNPLGGLQAYSTLSVQERVWPSS